jgi:von Willebrand factor type A domain-containing protein
MIMMNRLTASAALACSLAWACAAGSPVVVHDDDESSQGATGGTSGGFLLDDDGDPSGGSSGTGGSGGSNGSIRCGAPVGGSSCGGQVFAGKNIPLDIYIMFDQSGSMCACLDPGAGQLCVASGCTTTRLDAVRQAIKQFVSDPNSAGIGVGLGVFGQQPIGETSCEVSDYGTPAVRVGVLPDQTSALTEALDGLEPTGETPTGPALRGACEYAKGYRASEVDHQVAILLLTDGRPEAPSTCRGGAGACCPNLDDAVQAADVCRTDAGIRTFVVGIGPLLDNLEQIAIAGGTERAYLVQGGDVGNEVLNALNRIRGAAAIPCELPLPEPPPGQALALDAINLDYEGGEGAQCARTPFSAVSSADGCGDGDGWHYDDPDAPQSILLCPHSCDRVSGPGGNLFYSVGCATRLR